MTNNQTIVEQKNLLIFFASAIRNIVILLIFMLFFSLLYDTMRAFSVIKKNEYIVELYKQGLTTKEVQEILK